MGTDRLTNTVERDGFARIESLISEAECSRLRHDLKDCGYATRDLLERESVRSLAVSPEVSSIVESVIGRGWFAVRGIFFDKTRDANWKVVWHQDRAIPVIRRIEVGGFGPWSTKQGVAHALAPAEILECMVAVRIHLDVCDEGNGPLRVVPCSHRSGILTENEIDLHRTGEQVECQAKAGDAILMRPLLLHSSSSSKRPDHRRVIHIEYAACELPGGLEWNSRVH